MRGAAAQLFTATGKEKGERACRQAVEKQKPSGTLFANYGKFGANMVCLGNGVKMLGYGQFVWGKVGDGLHSTTRYGELDSVTSKRRNSLGVVYRNWHPGPLSFQLLSDVFGYYYMEALLKALDMISEHKNDNYLELYGERELLAKVSDLPAPVYCNPQWCNQVPKCLYM